VPASHAAELNRRLEAVRRDPSQAFAPAEARRLIKRQ
jgi:hypothetical protein